MEMKPCFGAPKWGLHGWCWSRGTVPWDCCRCPSHGSSFVPTALDIACQVQGSVLWSGLGCVESSCNLACPALTPEVKDGQHSARGDRHEPTAETHHQADDQGYVVCGGPTIAVAYHCYCEDGVGCASDCKGLHTCVCVRAKAWPT